MTDAGIITEFCTCSDEESAIAYAKDNNIPKVIVVDENTKVIEVDKGTE